MRIGLIAGLGLSLVCAAGAHADGGLYDRMKQITYVNSDDHVCEFCCDQKNGNAWTWADLTSQQPSGADLSSQQPKPRGVASTGVGFAWGDYMKQVIYLDEDGDIRELYCPTTDYRWRSVNLTSITHSTRETPISGNITGYAWTDEMKQVNFISRDGHVHELCCSRPDFYWRAADLTQLAESDSIAVPGTLSGYAWGPEMKQVDYIGQDGHVHELRCNNPDRHWKDYDLTNDGSGVEAAPTRPIGFAWGLEMKQVAYMGQDQHIHELSCSNPDRKWTDNDLTTLSGEKKRAVAGSLVGYAIADQKFVAFLTEDGHIHELTCSRPNRQWTEADLTAAASAHTTSAAKIIAAYGWSGINQIAYLADDGKIHELYCTYGAQQWTKPAWTDVDLAAMTNTTNTEVKSGLLAYGWEPTNKSTDRDEVVSGYINAIELVQQRP